MTLDVVLPFELSRHLGEMLLTRSLRVAGVKLDG